MMQPSPTSNSQIAAGSSLAKVIANRVARSSFSARSHIVANGEQEARAAIAATDCPMSAGCATVSATVNTSHRSGIEDASRSRSARSRQAGSA